MHIGVAEAPYAFGKAIVGSSDNEEEQRGGMFAEGTPVRNGPEDVGRAARHP